MAINKVIPDISRMFKQLIAQMQRLTTITWIAEFLALVGGAYFIKQVRIFAITLPSVIDEGMYLYKGYLFALGRYAPFQDFGAWTDHMPLSFLIPGYVQRLFGPGIRTGRYYAIALAIIMIVGLWIVARRLGGKWWAAAAVWVYALNPAQAQIYSAAASQILIAALLMWILVFVLGRDRPLWQLMLGTTLASVAFLSRINILPVLVFLLIYIYLQYGKKFALICASLGALIVVVVHAVYWPEILKLWVAVTPRSLTPFLDQWLEPLGADKSYAPEFSLVHRISSLLIALRYYFLSISGLVFFWLAWPQIRKIEDITKMRDYFFVFFLFVTLLVAHVTVTILFSYCVFCLPNYLAFFSEIGVLLIVISFPHLTISVNRIKQFILIGIALLLTEGVLIGARGSIIPAVTKFLFSLERASLLSVSRGTLYGSLAVFLVVAPLVVFAFTYVIRKLQVRLWQKRVYDYGQFTLITIFALGFVLSPTDLFSGETGVQGCGENIINSYEQVGFHLREVVPEDALVFWRGGNPLPLLYIPEVQVFPAQLSGAYSYKVGGDLNELEKYGYWNDALGREWLDQADVVIVYSSDSLAGAEIISQDLFVELERTPGNLACVEGAKLAIFTRIIN